MLPTAWEPEVGRRGGVAGAPSPRWPGSDYCGRELWGRRSLAGPSRKKSVSGPGAPRLPAAPRAAVWLGGPWQEGEPGREWTRRSGQRLSRAPKPGARTPPPPPPSPGRERTGGGGAGGAGATQGEGAIAAGRGPRSRGHGREGRASELPTPTAPVLGADPLKQSPRCFFKVPTPMFSPTFLLHWGAEGFPLGDPPPISVFSRA